MVERTADESTIKQYAEVTVVNITVKQPLRSCGDMYAGVTLITSCVTARSAILFRFQYVMTRREKLVISVSIAITCSHQIIPSSQNKCKSSYNNGFNVTFSNSYSTFHI